jgi:hypothetical protein
MEISSAELEVYATGERPQTVTQTVRFPRSNAYAQILISFISKRPEHKLQYHSLTTYIERNWSGCFGDPGVSGGEFGECVEGVDSVFAGGGDVGA